MFFAVIDVDLIMKRIGDNAFFFKIMKPISQEDYIYLITVGCSIQILSHKV
jgi:hypothetical protein